MSLVNCAVVHAGRVCKVIDVESGYATIAYIDWKDRIITKQVPAASVIKFADAVRPRSAWPDSAIPEESAEPRRRRAA